MSNRSGPLSPLSTDGSEWSGYSRYQSTGPPPYSPSISYNRGNLVTPPVSGSSNGSQPGMLNGMSRRPGGPSPPESIARSSYGTSLSSSDRQRRRTVQMEEDLSRHYAILSRYLAQSLRDEKANPKQNKARDKLLRLSPVQFQELSTDVYDELLRRQSAAGQHPEPQRNGPGQIPPYLLPKDTFHPKRNQARQKLATLPPPRFRDLATDVFYELERRFTHFAGRDIARNGSPAPSMGGSPSRVGTPNGTRPNSRGPTGRPGGHGGPGGSDRWSPRKASLGGQVMQGLGIPGVEEPYGQRPTARTFQSNTLIPNKSTIVEDDDDDISSEIYGSRRNTSMTSRSMGGSDKDRKAIAGLESQVGDLQGKVEELEGQVRDKDSAIDKLQGSYNEQQEAISAERDTWARLQSDLENKLRDALNLNTNMQVEIDKVQQDHKDTERKLRSQMDDLNGRGNGEANEWKSRYESLDKAHQDLRTELLLQEKVTSEVRQEAAGFLNQMKALSGRTGQSIEREEELVNQLHMVEDEVKEWKSRYARTRTQIRTLRASSMAISIQQPDVGQLVRDGGFTAQDGLVKDVHVTKFQIAIDELLRSARGKEPQAALAHVKSVVIAVRNITMDMGDTQSSKDDQIQERHKVKTKVSATANNLITASKNFAISNGLSPVSLLDAAASHLTASIIELISMVKIHPTPAEELEDDDENSVIADSPMDFYGINNASSSTITASVCSPLGSPRLVQKAYQPPSQFNVSKPLPNGLQNGAHEQNSSPKPVHRDSTIEALRNFLQSRTDNLVHSVQTLVSSIRNSSEPPEILDTIQSITSTTSQIVAHTASTVPQNSQASAIAKRLSKCVERLEAAGRDGEEIQSEKDWKDYIKSLPPLAFEIARETKELAAWVDRDGEDDFS